MTMKAISMADVSNEIDSMVSTMNNDNIVVNTKLDRDTLSMTVSIVDEFDEKSILILAAHDTVKGIFSIFVLKKYLPNIITSTKNMLSNKKVAIA